MTIRERVERVANQRWCFTLIAASMSQEPLNQFPGLQQNHFTLL